jgi:hypothetical protein
MLVQKLRDLRGKAPRVARGCLSADVVEEGRARPDFGGERVERDRNGASLSSKSTICPSAARTAARNGLWLFQS